MDTRPRMVSASTVKNHGIDNSIYNPNRPVFDSKLKKGIDNSIYNPNRSKQCPDMLPYRIQHRVFTAIQTILEEGCYDFAMKWLPHILLQNDWVCPEMVEMPKWKMVLLSYPLPIDSITPEGREMLKARLTEAVWLRNITAHRQPSDNEKIRKMIVSAKLLMAILQDTNRVQKLERLHCEIAEWEATERMKENWKMFGGVLTAAGYKIMTSRRKLHRSLDEITEQEVAFDEMDWLPAGEELGSDESDEQSYDAMDLD